MNTPVKRSVSQSVFTITEKAPNRAFSWLRAPTTAFTFKTLLRHYAKQSLTPHLEIGPISGCGCLLDEPASQWEECIYIRTFATHLPISMCLSFTNHVVPNGKAINCIILREKQDYNINYEAFKTLKRLIVWPH